MKKPKRKPAKKNIEEKEKEADQVQAVAKAQGAEEEEEADEEAEEEAQTFGLEGEGGILITAKANQLSDIIRRFCVPTTGKEALINPLPIRVKDGKLETEANSRYKGLAVFGGFKVDHQGEGEVCVDPIEFRAFLDLYGDQGVAIHFSDEGRITIRGERRSSVLYALAEAPPFYEPSYTLEDDGHVRFKNKKKTDWVATLKAKELADAASPSNLLGVKTWTVNGDDDGLVLTIGTTEGKGRTVKTRVPCQFGEADIKDCGSEFGEDFGTLMNVISGNIELATGGDAPKGKVKMPAIITNGSVTYTVMPRKPQEE